MGDSGSETREKTERYRHRRLGELLVAAGAITEDQLGDALETQLAAGGRLGQVLIARRLISEGQLAQTIAEQHGLPLVDLGMYEVDLTAVGLLPRAFAERHLVLPIGYVDGELVVAMADPLDVQTLDSLATMTGKRLRPVVGTESALAAAIDRYIGPDETFDEVVQEAAAHAGPAEAEQLEALIEDVPVVKLVNRILTEAVRQNASDVHVEPQADAVRVRYRVDGVLHDVMTIPRSVQAALISRIKIISDLNIAERRLPQDGRAGLVIAGRAVDIRVATLPTAHGENVSLRLLAREFSFIDLKHLGLDEDELVAVRRALTKPWGALLVCGPTGAGKTTTLYAALRELNAVERKIITIEDPIEYQIDGASQIQVMPRIGLTFASGLRAILRADPDVVLVGEMRDPETAQIAVRGAMTGHLVLSSLHTNDAPSALARLVDVGVPAFLIPGAVVGILAQRLVRRLCGACRVAYEGDAAVLAEMGLSWNAAEPPVFHRAGGCEECFGTGYRGRLGVFEYLEMTPELSKLTLKGVPVDEVREVATRSGMRGMRQDAVRKVITGLTSLEEVSRVLG